MESEPPVSLSALPDLATSKSEDLLKSRSPNGLINEYLVKREPVFAQLQALREKGWSNPSGDKYFKQQRSRADGADDQAAWRFYLMMQRIGDEMQEKTRALDQCVPSDKDMFLLDLCMAPGGYTAAAVKHNRRVRSYGMTLHPDQGGHKLLYRSENSEVRFEDITLFSKECGVDKPPTTHPECASFSTDRPWSSINFHLVLCDGQVLRNHERAEYRQYLEPVRLTTSQLILALQRVRMGGTIIILLHKLESWDTFELISKFDSFSDIQLFKPGRAHAIRSSFYLIARSVRPDSEAARDAVNSWKYDWEQTTFGGENTTGIRIEWPSEEHVVSLLDSFGEKLIELGRPIWDIQARALANAEFTK